MCVAVLDARARRGAVGLFPVRGEPDGALPRSGGGVGLLVPDARSEGGDVLEVQLGQGQVQPAAQRRGVE